MVLVKYSLADNGEIAGVWSAPTEDLLLPNVIAEDPDYGYLLTDAIEEPRQAGLRYRVNLPTSTLHEKEALLLTALPTPFIADGVAECLVTVEPFMPCTILVNRQPVELTTEDATLVLTSDVPARFLIELAPLVTHWAMPITIEAL